jgi:hypothetical protein
MFIGMSDRFPETTTDAISKFESQCGVGLPPSYRSFLLKFNGGRPVERLFPLPGVSPPTEFEIHFFYGIDAPLRCYDLASMYEFFRAGIPSGIVPIGTSAFACSYYCLDLRDGKTGVCFWDQTHHWGTGEWREEDLYIICETFDQFLAMLYS